MGISLFKLNSNSTYDQTSTQPISVNPNPNNYKILRWEYVNHYLIIAVKYPDCTNYEGVKILVYDKKYSIHQLKNQDSIDPHFSNNRSKISPLARFEPTLRGMKMAKIMCKVL
jgi:hypothetical protein